MLTAQMLAELQEGPALSAALSKSLCLLHKATLTAATKKLMPRILCLHGSRDAASQYIAVMNCIFSAQVRLTFSLGCALQYCCVFVQGHADEGTVVFILSHILATEQNCTIKLLVHVTWSVC